jgi:hypothetical protein
MRKPTLQLNMLMEYDCDRDTVTLHIREVPRKHLDHVLKAVGNGLRQQITDGAAAQKVASEMGIEYTRREFTLPGEEA